MNFDKLIEALSACPTSTIVTIIDSLPAGHQAEVRGYLNRIEKKRRIEAEKSQKKAKGKTDQGELFGFTFDKGIGYQVVQKARNLLYLVKAGKEPVLRAHKAGKDDVYIRVDIRHRLVRLNGKWRLMTMESAARYL